MKFFEPDVFVEAAPGLAAACGISDDGFGSDRRVLPLDDVAQLEENGGCQFRFGLCIFDLYRSLYEREFQFVSRHERRIAHVSANRFDQAFVEAAFGLFPTDEHLSFIERGYCEAFDPERISGTDVGWRQVVQGHLTTPLQLTTYGIEREPGDWHDPVLFVVDPSSPIDLIDLWNIRQFHADVLPVNINWVEETKDLLRERIDANHRPLPNNPHGVMIHTTIEFARSIPEERAQSVRATLVDGLPENASRLKCWYDPIWQENRDDMIWQPRRARLAASSTDLDLAIAKGESAEVHFRALAPNFADQYGANAAGWANVLKLRDYGNREGLALLLPSNTKTAWHPRIGPNDPPLISSEGWVLLQQFKDSREYLRLTTGREAIIDWLKDHGAEARPSESGRIADQVLSAVGGFWRAHILADKDTLCLLDKMAKSVRKHADGTSEEYPDRTIAAREWTRLIHQRNNRRPLPKLELDDFVKAGVLRLGLAIRCTNCEKQNWFGLDDLSERVRCERCLQEFSFPQGSLDPHRTPWQYRVVGPFSVPDFAAGAYATVLALRTFAQKLGVGGPAMTFSTNLNLSIGDEDLEVDFAFWFRRERSLAQDQEPALVLGEAKSFAAEAVTEKDVSRMKRVAQQFPGAFIVFAFLKNKLSEREKERVGRLALWGRVLLADHRPRAPVIVLTGTELLADWDIKQSWTSHGGQRARLVEPPSVWLDNLWTLADLTQQVHLTLPVS